MRHDGSPPADRGFEPGASHLLPRFQEGEARSVVLDAASPHAIEWTAERIAAGGVVALPTDTVYGIAAALSYTNALDRLYAVKGRPENQPLPVLVSSTHALARLTPGIDENITLLLEAFWPGPLTACIPAASGLPRHVVGPDNTIGVRLPNHPLAIEVIDKSGGAVACTSANRSGAPPALSAGEVERTIGPDLDLILDGGRAPGGVPSTVVVIVGEDLRVVREGSIEGREVRAVWEEVLAGA